MAARRIDTESEAGAVHSSIGQGQVLLTIAFYGMAVATNLTNHAPLLPLLTEDLRFTAVEAGLFSGAMFLAVALGTFVGGIVVDRVGTRMVGVAGLLAMGLATAPLALATNLGDLVFWKIVSGFAGGAGFTAGTRYSSVALGKGRSQLSLGLYGGSNQLGAGLAVAGMPALAAGLGWRGAFVVVTVYSVLLAAAWAALPSGTSGRAGNPLAAVRQASTWQLGVVHIASFGLGIVLGNWVTIYFIQEHGLMLGLASSLGSAVLILGVVSRPLGGVLLRRGLLGTGGLLRLGLLLNLGGLAAMALPGRPLALAMLGVLLLGVGVSLPYAAVFGMAAILVPAAPAAAQGLAGALGLLGIVPSTATVGWLYAQTGGFAAPLAALAISVAAGLWAARSVARTIARAGSRRGP